MRTVLVCAVTALALGCAAAHEKYAVRRDNLSCDEANRYAFRTVRNLGYKVTAFEPASPKGEGWTSSREQGMIRASQKGEQGATHWVSVKIDCYDDGVELTARDDRALSQDVTFARGFFLTFTSLADSVRATEAYAAEVAAATPGGVDLTIEPQVGLESKLDFGADLQAGGVLAVRVTVHNGTDRTYSLDAGSIELRPREGAGKIKQLPLGTAAANVARAAAAEMQEGIPPPEPAAIETLLRERALQGGTLEPGAKLEGFLYFPSGDYARARATLVDVATSESEGFLVEF